MGECVSWPPSSWAVSPDQARLSKIALSARQLRHHQRAQPHVGVPHRWAASRLQPYPLTGSVRPPPVVPQRRTRGLPQPLVQRHPVPQRPRGRSARASFQMLDVVGRRRPVFSRTIVARSKPTTLKRLRQQQNPRWTLDHLAAELARIGVPITRDALVNIEYGRRDTLSIGEWFGLAAVFDVPPAALLAPDPVEPITVLPDRPPVPGTLLIKWITGEVLPWMLAADPYAAPEAAERRFKDAAGRLAACRTHDELVEDVMLADGPTELRRAVVRLADHRESMEVAGRSLPELPPEVDRAITAVHRARTGQSSNAAPPTRPARFYTAAPPSDTAIPTTPAAETSDNEET